MNSFEDFRVMFIVFSGFALFISTLRLIDASQKMAAADKAAAKAAEEAKEADESTLDSVEKKTSDSKGIAD